MNQPFGMILEADVVGNIHDVERDKKIKEGNWKELELKGDK
jgi:hypothetical protein